MIHALVGLLAAAVMAVPTRHRRRLPARRYRSRRPRRDRGPRPRGRRPRPGATTSATSTASRPSRTRAVLGRHPALVLREAGRAAGRRRGVGRVAARRPHRGQAEGLARIVGRWTRGCADDGFDAVEYDNLDSFTRSHGLLRRRQAMRYAGCSSTAHTARPCGRAEEPRRLRRHQDRLRLRGRRGVRPVRRVRARTSTTSATRC